jgi:hypothetical protein
VRQVSPFHIQTICARTAGRDGNQLVVIYCRSDALAELAHSAPSADQQAVEADGRTLPSSRSPDSRCFLDAVAAQRRYVRQTVVSAPDLARELEQEWRQLPEPRRHNLTFRVLDRMLRKNLANCFARSGYHAEAKRLVEWRRLEDADSWRHSLLALRDFSQVIPGEDAPLLAAFCCVMGNLPASLLNEPADTVLRRASVTAIILENMSVGSFDGEVAAQRDDVRAILVAGAGAGH